MLVLAGNKNSSSSNLGGEWMNENGETSVRHVSKKCVGVSEKERVEEK